LEEHGAGAGGFLLGAAALLGLVHAGRRNDRRYDGLACILCGQDRPSEIARQRRPENGAGIVARQASETVGGLPVGGVTMTEQSNNHLQYMLTWYGLAAALVAVTGLALNRRRRGL